MMKRTLFLLGVIVLAAYAMAALLGFGRGALVRQEALHGPRIYAYRGWQSLGLFVKQGDRIDIQAQGSWLYTPDEYHGPEGHARYPAPPFYPLPGVAGGALIGRIGETGQPFLVGRRTSWFAERDGLLYLRIDDDLLGDNEGSVAVEVTITKPEVEQ
jgi:hypothetical protein